MDVSIHQYAAWAMVISGAASFVALLTISAPYGRYSTGGAWGPLVNPKIAWMLWELPALAIPLALILGIGSSGPAPLASFLAHPLSKRTLLAAAFIMHYTYRVIVFPLSTRGGKPAPLSVMFLSWTFCVWNGFLQGWFIVYQLPPDSPVTPQVAAGILMWFVGWVNVMIADRTLINLRKPGETGYKIPRGGLFEFVSAANYTSEIFEWSGYALAAGALPAVAFAFFTFCNLVPRGASHHKWYQEKFEDYPQKRKAVVPFMW